MANDPVLSASVIGQSVSPSCSVRNFVSDELGRVLMVPASSAPLNVSVAASTVNALSSSTSQIGSIANSSFTVGGTVDVGSINNIVFVTPSTQWTVTVSTANTQSVAVSSAIALSSSVLFVGSVVVSSSNTQSVALTSGSLTLGLLSTAQVVTTTTTSVVGLTTTSLVALTSSALTIGVLSTAQVVTTSTTSNVGLTTTSLVSLTSSALTIGAITNSSFTVANIAEVVPTSTVGTQTTVSVTSSTATQLLLAPNASRKGVIFFAGTSPVYLAFTSTAALSQPSTTNYSVSVAGSALYALTLGSNAMFTGGVLAVAGLLTGSTVKVTEFT